VTGNGIFPGFKHFLVVLFFISDAFLIVKLGQLCGTFIVHFLLDIAADLSITLTNLTKNVSLVCLLVHRDSHGFLSKGLILSINLCLVLVSLILFEPLTFILHLLFEFNVSFTILVDIL
jgi:hypothetical protein